MTNELYCGLGTSFEMTLLRLQTEVKGCYESPPWWRMVLKMTNKGCNSWRTSGNFSVWFSVSIFQQPKAMGFLIQPVSCQFVNIFAALVPAFITCYLVCHLSLVFCFCLVSSNHFYNTFFSSELLAHCSAPCDLEDWHILLCPVSIPSTCPAWVASLLGTYSFSWHSSKGHQNAILSQHCMPFILDTVATIKCNFNITFAIITLSDIWQACLYAIALCTIQLLCYILYGLLNHDIWSS